MIEMGFEELFIRFWWLIFPIFGMFMAVWGMRSHERRHSRTLDLIKTYVEQGKDPPAELLESARETGHDKHDSSPNGTAITAVVFTALAISFALGANMIKGEQVSVVFLMLAAGFGITALGTFFILMFGTRSDK